MSTATIPAAPERSTASVPLEQIATGGNVRELDEAHVDALAASMRLRGLVQPIAVATAGEGRFDLIAGEHRLAAARKLGWPTIAAVVGGQEGAAGDQGAENTLRKNLTPLEEARAARKILDEGYSPDGAATVLGWSKRRVTSRLRILELPEPTQQLIGTGALPVSALDALLTIAAVSVPAVECLTAVIAGDESAGVGEGFARDPGWMLARALQYAPKELFAATLGQLAEFEIVELRLGKRATAAYEEARTLHDRLDRFAYGPPRIAFAEPELDQARAAGVLLELGGRAFIFDRDLYREVVRAAIIRVRDELQARAAHLAEEKVQARSGQRERTPSEQLEGDHRAVMREHTARAHNVNLDIGAALVDGLATVDPANMDVARFFTYGLLGPAPGSYGAHGDHVKQIAANGIRLAFDAHRTVETPTRKDGTPGKTKITYSDPEEAIAWLWTFLNGAKTAGELYGRTLVCLAAQHYALQLVLPASQRRGSALPASHQDRARKAFEKTTRSALPGSYRQLTRAIERAAREHTAQINGLTDPNGSSDGKEDGE